MEEGTQVHQAQAPMAPEGTTKHNGQLLPTGGLQKQKERGLGTE